MTPGRLLWLLRRDWRRGWRATYGDYFVRPRIWRWENPHSNEPLQTVPVHLVCGRDQLDLCAWTLASWTVETGRNWDVFLHDDGTLPHDAADRLRGLGLAVTPISRAEADVAMSERLRDNPECLAYRASHPLGLKIFDTPALCRSRRYLLLDTDLAFFERPRAVLGWVDRDDSDECWFNQDVGEASNLSAEAARGFGVELWPRVNSGLCLLWRDAIDFDFCETLLAQSGLRHSGHFWRVEQTLFAMCASRHGRGGLLDASYEVSLGKNAAPGCVMRHYVGTVRDLYYAEAFPRLSRKLLSPS